VETGIKHAARRQMIGLVLGLLLAAAGLLVAIFLPADPRCPEGWGVLQTQGRLFCHDGTVVVPRPGEVRVRGEVRLPAAARLPFRRWLEPEASSLGAW
jgi:hypothetical protein